MSLLVALALSGCELLGGQTGQGSASFPCPTNQKTSVPLDQISAIGVSANDLLASLPPLGGSLHIYRPGQNDTLTLSLANPSAAREVTNCRIKTLEVDAVATLLTDDGLFDATLPVTLEAEASNNWHLQGQRKLSELAGSYDWSVFPLDKWKDPSLQLQARPEQAGSGGTAAVADGVPVVGSLSLVGGDPNPSDGVTPVAALVGDWVSAEPNSGGGSGGGGNGVPGNGGAAGTDGSAGSSGNTGNGGGSEGGNGSPGAAGTSVGGVNSAGGAGGG